MPDIWLLVFISRGLIGSAGDAMPLEQCEARARDLAPDLSHVVCINTHDPSCRIYRDRSTNLAQWQQELEQRCRRRGQTTEGQQPMSKYPAFGTAPIRCGRTRCSWRGYETDLSKTPGSLGGVSCSTSTCPTCGSDSYSFMTPREIKAWESKKAAQAEPAPKEAP